MCSVGDDFLPPNKKRDVGFCQNLLCELPGMMRPEICDEEISKKKKIRNQRKVGRNGARGFSSGFSPEPRLLAPTRPTIFLISSVGGHRVNTVPTGVGSPGCGSWGLLGVVARRGLGPCGRPPQPWSLFPWSPDLRVGWHGRGHRLPVCAATPSPAGSWSSGGALPAAGSWGCGNTHPTRGGFRQCGPILLQLWSPQVWHAAGGAKSTVQPGCIPSEGC